MYDEKIEALISAALADGTLTEKEKQILFKRAQAEGIDLDEFEMVLDAKLFELKKTESAQAEKSAPKSDKFGDVRKCPSCGAVVAAGIAKCVECGYAFMNIEALSSRQKLYEALIDVDKNFKQKSIWETTPYLDAKEKANQRAIIISTFPLPNTKADLLDFLAFVKPQANKNARNDYMSEGGMKAAYAQEDLGLAYWRLFETCINHAQISFNNDPDFNLYIDYFNQIMNKESEKTGLGGFFSKFLKK